ncbi:MAG: OvmZ protein [Kitasatospora sp.]|nr:OvmZ protein [Kitasatospora sp.]
MKSSTTIRPTNTHRTPADGPGTAAAPGPRHPSPADRSSRLQRDLAALPGLFEECALALTPAAGRPKERVSGTRGTGLPLDEAALAARTEVLAVLRCWTALVVGEQRSRAPEQQTVPALVRFLTDHLDWLAAHPAAADFADEVTALVSAADRAAHPDTALRLELGPCVQPGCDGVMFSTARAGDSAPGRKVRCGAGHFWPPHQWLLLARGMVRGDHRAAAENETENGEAA